MIGTKVKILELIALLSYSTRIGLLNVKKNELMIYLHKTVLVGIFLLKPILVHGFPDDSGSRVCCRQKQGLVGDIRTQRLSVDFQGATCE